MHYVTHCFDSREGISRALPVQLLTHESSCVCCASMTCFSECVLSLVLRALCELLFSFPFGFLCDVRCLSLLLLLLFFSFSDESTCERERKRTETAPDTSTHNTSNSALHSTDGGVCAGDGMLMFLWPTRARNLGSSSVRACMHDRPVPLPSHRRPVNMSAAASDSVILAGSGIVGASRALNCPRLEQISRGE